MNGVDRQKRLSQTQPVRPGMLFQPKFLTSELREHQCVEPLQVRSAKNCRWGQRRGAMGHNQQERNACRGSRVQSVPTGLGVARIAQSFSHSSNRSKLRRAKSAPEDVRFYQTPNSGDVSAPRRRLSSASSARGSFECNAATFMPELNYTELIACVRGARHMVHEKRRLIEEAEAEKIHRQHRAEREALERRKRRLAVYEERLQIFQQKQEAARVEAFEKTKCIEKAKRIAQVSANRASQVQSEKERQELMHRNNFGPLTCTNPDVGLTVSKKMDESCGVQVHTVTKRSLAEKAGITTEDVILDINGRNVTHATCEKVIRLLDKHSHGTLKIRIVARTHITSSHSINRFERTVRLKNPQAAITATEITTRILDDAASYTELILRGKGLTKLPAAVSSFVNIQILDLADNQIITLPDSIGALSELRRLDCSSNLLSNLPETLGDLQKLISLYLFEGNALTELPESVGKLQELKTLNVPYNELFSLPKSLGQCRNLVSLWISNNKLTGLPDLSTLLCLRRLVADSNPFKEIPSTLRHLIGLEHLSLCQCHLNRAPTWIGNLVQLRTLKLAGNDLVEVPGSLNAMIYLEELDLGGNRLRSLPSEMENLTALSSLYLERNPLRFLPPGVVGLQGVNRVNFGFLPSHICPDMKCCGSLLVDPLDESFVNANEIEKSKMQVET